jgi:hypothetical protein
MSQKLRFAGVRPDFPDRYVVQRCGGVLPYELFESVDWVKRDHSEGVLAYFCTERDARAVADALNAIEEAK